MDDEAFLLAGPRLGGGLDDTGKKSVSSCVGTGGKWSGIFVAVSVPIIGSDGNSTAQAEEELRRASEAAYEESCSKLGVLPKTAVLDQLSRPCMQLPGYGLGPQTGRAIGAALAVNRHVQYIDLSGNSLGTVGLEALALALVDNVTVTVLRVGDNDARGSPSLIRALVALVGSPRSQLCALSLANNLIGDVGMAKILRAVKDPMTELDVSGTGCGPQSGLCLLPLVNGGCIRRLAAAHISMASTFWHGRFLGPIAAAPEAVDLVALDLSHNTLGPESVPDILRCIRSLPRLEMLDITGCSLGPDCSADLLGAFDNATSALQAVVVDADLGNRIHRLLKERKRAAKRAAGKGEPPSDDPLELKFDLIMRAGTAAEAKQMYPFQTASGINMNAMHGTDFLKPSSRLLSGADMEMPDSGRRSIQASPFERAGEGANGAPPTPQNLSAVQHRLSVDSPRVPPPAPAPKLPWEGDTFSQAQNAEIRDLEREAAFSGSSGDEEESGGRRWRQDDAAGDLGGAAGAGKRTSGDWVLGSGGVPRMSRLRLSNLSPGGSSPAAPVPPSPLQRQLHAMSRASEHGPSWEAAAQYLDAMRDGQEDPAMTAGFRSCLAGIRIRRQRVLQEPVRPMPRRNGWGRWPDESSEDEAEEDNRHRRHAKYAGSAKTAPPPSPPLCAGYEDMLRRLWPKLARAPDGPEWERYRMRKYLTDAQAGLRATYDYYRALPPAGHEAAVDARICTGAQHCRQPRADAKLPDDEKEFSECAACRAAGRLTLEKMRRIFIDVDLQKGARNCQPAVLNRVMQDTFREVAEADLGPDPIPLPEPRTDMERAKAAAAAAVAAADNTRPREGRVVRRRWSIAKGDDEMEKAVVDAILRKMNEAPAGKEEAKQEAKQEEARQEAGLEAEEAAKEGAKAGAEEGPAAAVKGPARLSSVLRRASVAKAADPEEHAGAPRVKGPESVMHSPDLTQFGFYEWVEALFHVSCAVFCKSDPNVAWAFDQLALRVAPDDCEHGFLPASNWAFSSYHYTAHECEANGDPPGKSRLPVKQPALQSWAGVSCKLEAVVPPHGDARDLFKKRMQGLGVRNFMAEHRERLQRAFLLYANMEKNNGKAKVFNRDDEDEHGDVTMNVNEFIRMFEMGDLFDAAFTPLKLQKAIAEMTEIIDVMSHEHPNNESIELVFDEWLELLARCVPILRKMPEDMARANAEMKELPKAQAALMFVSMDYWLDAMFYPAVLRMWPGSATTFKTSRFGPGGSRQGSGGGHAPHPVPAAPAAPAEGTEAAAAAEQAAPAAAP